MVQIVKEGSIEIEDEMKSSIYWKRHKKPNVDFIQGNPFASDRQLEDQRLLIQKNRNPQADIPTKVDKVRSQQIIAKKGASRSVAIKANVLNKIVREATGDLHYTIIPPPRMEDDESVREKLDPETNPFLRSYASEAKSKPILCSFGHRPKSASRTFHPSTMKVRLKPGEVLPNLEGKTTIGLPVAVLAQVLHAPKIENTFEQSLISQSAPSTSNGPNLHHDAVDFHGLFFTKEQESELFAKNKMDDASKHTWISTKEETQRKKLKKNKKKIPELEPLFKDDSKPTWDEGFHRSNLPLSGKVNHNASIINTKQDLPLGELLKRFSSLTFYENQKHPFCQEKQDLDRIQRSGVLPEVPKAVAPKGQKLYYDPWDVNVKAVKSLRKAHEEEKQEEIKAQEYQKLLETIPKVNYYPTTKLFEMKTNPTQAFASLKPKKTRKPKVEEVDGEFVMYHNPQQKKSTKTLSPSKKNTLDNSISHLDEDQEHHQGEEDINNEEVELDHTTSQFTSTSSKYFQELESKYPNWCYSELEYKHSLMAAKMGNPNALYDINIRKHLHSPISMNSNSLNEEENEITPRPRSTSQSKQTTPQDVPQPPIEEIE